MDRHLTVLLLALTCAASAVGLTGKGLQSYAYIVGGIGFVFAVLWLVANIVENESAKARARAAVAEATDSDR